MATRHCAEVDWSTRFKRGDVIRSKLGGELGVILAVVRNQGVTTWWELHVDTSEGVGICYPEEAVLAPDDASRQEALRLGLRGLDSSSRP